jgi:putative FmdB family regulatory protein
VLAHRVASLCLVPIYEYKCPNGHVFELFQRMSDAQPETCPTCGAGPLEKVLYPVAVHFKGSGFYTTDYGRGSKRGGGGGGEKSDSGGGEGGGESSSKSDTKEKAKES